MGFANPNTRGPADRLNVAFIGRTLEFASKILRDDLVSLGSTDS